MGHHASIGRMLTIAFATGTEPGKWFRRYEELSGTRLSTLPSTNPLAETADLYLVRLPDTRVDDTYHVVRLYEETPGVAVPKESVYAEVGEPVDAAELRDEIVNFDFYSGGSSEDAVEELAAALQVVAANVGVAYAPLPLVRALSKKQVSALECVCAEVEPTGIALVWKKERDAVDIQDFVGVAKGRTVRSSRGAGNAKKTNVQHRKTRNRKKR